MSGASLPYQLRPNKAVDRELFLSLLMRLSPTLALEKYHYVGLGGPFLEDFRLIHSRLGIGRRRRGRTVGRLTCVESELEVHKRQQFNRPVASIRCVHATLEGFLDQSSFTAPVIVWFDYTSPRHLASQISRFAKAVGEFPLNSVIRITLNASPATLGKPKEHLAEEELWAWRLSELRQRLGTIFPNDLSARDMETKAFGPSVLRALHLAVQKELLSHSDRRVVWALSTHYADAQPMVTAALIICAETNTDIEPLVKRWEFYTTLENPHRLDLPSLSSLERLTLESHRDARRRLGFDLASVVESRLGDDPFEIFKKFYRLYPHFSRVELL